MWKPTEADGVGGGTAVYMRGRSNNYTLSVIVPMYNEAEALDAFFSRLVPVLEQAAPRFEIVCVNDGSSDETLAALEIAQATWSSIKIINLSRNFGKEAALTAGLDFCSGDAVVPIDADLQDPPEVITEFVMRWREGADVVVGVRGDRSADTFVKRVTARWFYALFNRFSDTPIPSDAGDFRLMDRQVVEIIRQLPERTRFMKGLFAWVGFRTEEVKYVREARSAGQGKWKAWALWNFALEGIFSFSTTPLKIWMYFGALVASLSIGYMLFLILRTLIIGIDVPGYTSLAVLILFSLGLNLVNMGIIGEYIGRIYTEVKGRPIYVIAPPSRSSAPTERAGQDVTAPPTMSVAAATGSGERLVERIEQ